MSEGDHLSFWAVHDAFGTHACDIDLMREIVKSAFFDMHQGRSLNDWTAEMKWVGKKKTSRVKIGSLWKDPEKSGKTAGDYLITSSRCHRMSTPCWEAHAVPECPWG